MLWIDSVRSAEDQTAKGEPRATANTAVLSSSGIPRASVRLSVISVPTTLTSTTVSQYTPGTYWRVRNCHTRAATNAALITSVVPDRPRPSPLRKSAKVSPTVVESTLMIQKKTVTSGTLLSKVRPEVDGATGLVMAPPCGQRSEHGLNDVGISVSGQGPWPVVDGARVLVVEDDSALRGAVARGLREAGLEVVTAVDGTSALKTVGPGPETRFKAVVLDIGLPDSDGRDVCQALRARGIDVPVLFLTARDQLHDVLAGFAAGGDDHLSKPFHVSELLARIGAIVRRGRPRPAADATELRLDLADHALIGPDGRQPLTPTEYRVLAALMGAPGQVVRRRALGAAGWPHGAMVADNTLDQYVARLRRKLASAGDPDRAIATAHGVGYRYG